MLLVIFGAGASYDSAAYTRDTSPALRPPLAKDLVGRQFDDIAMDLRSSRPIIDRLRERMDTAEAEPLEDALARLNEEAGDSAERRQQLIAFRFYLYRVIYTTVSGWFRSTGGFTHYLRLLNRLYDWQQATGTPIRLATFNYDTLLEEALTDILGTPFNRLADYVARQDVRLFKLHGSINWVRSCATSIQAGVDAITAAMMLAGENSLPHGDIMVRALTPQVEPGRRQPPPLDGPNELAIPALAVPMAAKTSFECPEPFVGMFKQDLPRVTHVLIIGWRAAEAHAVELLAGSAPTEGLMPGYALGIVDYAQSGVDAVKRNLGVVAEKAGRTLEELGGFSSFMQPLTEQATSFVSPAALTRRPLRRPSARPFAGGRQAVPLKGALGDDEARPYTRASSAASSGFTTAAP